MERTLAWTTDETAGRIHERESYLGTYSTRRESSQLAIRPDATVQDGRCVDPGGGRNFAHRVAEAAAPGLMDHHNALHLQKPEGVFSARSCRVRSFEGTAPGTGKFCLRRASS